MATKPSLSTVGCTVASKKLNMASRLVMPLDCRQDKQSHPGLLLTIPLATNHTSATLLLGSSWLTLAYSLVQLVIRQPHSSTHHTNMELYCKVSSHNTEGLLPTGVSYTSSECLTHMLVIMGALSSLQAMKLLKLLLKSLQKPNPQVISWLQLVGPLQLIWDALRATLWQLSVKKKNKLDAAFYQPMVTQVTEYHYFCHSDNLSLTTGAQHTLICQGFQTNKTLQMPNIHPLARLLVKFTVLGLPLVATNKV